MLAVRAAPRTPPGSSLCPILEPRPPRGAGRLPRRGGRAFLNTPRSARRAASRNHRRRRLLRRVGTEQREEGRLTRYPRGFWARPPRSGMRERAWPGPGRGIHWGQAENLLVPASSSAPYERQARHLERKKARARRWAKAVNALSHRGRRRWRRHQGLRVPSACRASAWPSPAGSSGRRDRRGGSRRSSRAGAPWGRRQR